VCQRLSVTLLSVSATALRWYQRAGRASIESTVQMAIVDSGCTICLLVNEGDDLIQDPKPTKARVTVADGGGSSRDPHLGREGYAKQQRAPTALVGVGHKV
jgi:hypothetical protein